VWLDEASKRLEQMGFLVLKVAELSQQAKLADEAALALKSDEIPDERLQMALGDECELYTEAFYYFGHRLSQSLHKAGLTNYVAPGIRAVRNNLLEHPIALGQNFAWGLPYGPIVKPFGERERVGRRSLKEIHDAGLYVNATEALDRLVKVLEPLVNVKPTRS
jgi:hypothetical protein